MLNLGAATLTFVPIDTSPRSITLYNDGTAPAVWAATAGASGVYTVSPSSGTLAAGGSTTLTVSANPAGLSEGDHPAVLTVSAPGTVATATIVGKLEVPPVITVTGTSTGLCSATIQAEVFDENPGPDPVGVVVGTTPVGVLLGTYPVYSGTVTFSSPGPKVVTLVTRDARDNPGSTTVPVTITSC